ncbi:hypothetical protein [Streptomyces deccanensis]|uniref:hypothetical protein n=1 Tax=Streptomyces deccanensis TaxID=424188 RepID=UPI001EFA7A92|nr:hypothetical protein [Streptomyces deccanensis]ULR50591.1 hypothetical protein L3078_15490 [Streptomyces deccanensis]
MPPETPRPTLSEAVGARFADQKNPNADAERQFAARLDADAKLHGTPAYDALPAEYRARVEARALEVARTTPAGQGGQE